MRVLAALTLLLASALPAAAQSIIPQHWGVEYWLCGPKTITLQMGNGANVWLDQVDIGVSGSASPGYENDPNYMLYQRQTLVSLAATQNGNPFTSTLVGTTPPGFNNEVDPNLLDINLKEYGDHASRADKTVRFPSGVMLYGGQLSLTIDNETYQYQNPPGGSVSAPVTQQSCMDTEIHLEIWYSTTQPTS